MLPVDFKYRNLVLGKPSNMTDEECMALPVWTDGKKYVSKWKLNKEELEEIQREGAIYFEVHGQSHPPIYPLVECPITGDYVKVGDKVNCKVYVAANHLLEIEGHIEDRNGTLMVIVGKSIVPFYLCLDAYIIQ
jgi:hypothetical protein